MLIKSNQHYQLLFSYYSIIIPLTNISPQTKHHTQTKQNNTNKQTPQILQLIKRISMKWGRYVMQGHNLALLSGSVRKPDFL